MLVLRRLPVAAAVVALVLVAAAAVVVVAVAAAAAGVVAVAVVAAVVSTQGAQRPTRPALPPRLPPLTLTEPIPTWLEQLAQVVLAAPMVPVA
jgi:hypothetical protein